MIPILFALYGSLSVASVYRCWLTYGYLNVDHVFHPSNVMWEWNILPKKTLFQRYFLCYSFPWNQETYLGYFAEVLANEMFGTVYAIVNLTLLFLFVSICQHHRAFYKMMKSSIDNWCRLKNGNRHDEEFICELIRFYVPAKEYVRNINKKDNNN